MRKTISDKISKYCLDKQASVDICMLLKVVNFNDLLFLKNERKWKATQLRSWPNYPSIIRQLALIRIIN